MSLRKQAEMIASSTAMNSQEVGMDLLTLIGLLMEVLPLLLQLPCFRNKTAAQVQKYVESSPNLARVLTASIVRRRGNKVPRSEAFAISDSILDHLTAAPESEVAAVMMEVAETLR